MKKKLIGLFLGIILLSTVPLAVGQEAVEETAMEDEIGETNSVVGITAMAGYIMNPERIGNRVSAKAAILGYYERGLLKKDTGIAILKNIQFKDGSLLYMSEPNDFGFVLVAGICTGFTIQGM
jgi:hypothetical protein